MLLPVLREAPAGGTEHPCSLLGVHGDFQEASLAAGFSVPARMTRDGRPREERE